MAANKLVAFWRGDFEESIHLGDAAVWQAGQGLVGAWGDPQAVILPRSSCKMIQALPLVESGAADSAGLTSRHLALACASHAGAARHTDLVTDWLDQLGLSTQSLLCGPQMPEDRSARRVLIKGDIDPDARHNNCSGKHTGFLTLARCLGAGPDYIDPAHPVQQAVRAAFEDVTGAPTPGWAIDGCSAPNFATTVAGLARAASAFAAARPDGDARARAMVRLREAMMAHPDLVAGEGRACTRLMRAANGAAAVKTGAEGVYLGIVPDRAIGFAVKIADGASRGAEAVAAALLAALGVLPPDHPEIARLTRGPLTNRRKIEVGRIRVAPSLADWRL